MNGTFDSLDSQFDIDEPSSTITPIVRLRTAWINERCAPELLPFEEIAMESLLASIQKQVDLIESERNTDADTNFEMTLVMTEIERAKFIIRSYLRTRLHKLEKYAAFIVRNQEQMDKLSDDETRFVIGFQTLVEKHYMDSSLHSLPATMQKFDEEKGRATMLPGPDLDSAVVCRVRQDIGDVNVNGPDAIEMSKDQIYLIRYRFIQDLLLQGRVDLI